MKALPDIPVGQAWNHAYGVDWTRPEFDLRKAFVCAVFSELVYRYVPSLEVGEHSRMWMVPCDAYQQIARGLAQSDFLEILRRSDVFEPEIILTGSVVGVVIWTRGVIIVALRGTAEFYDWVLDGDVRRRGWPEAVNGQKFHAGFFREAERCYDDLKTRLAAWNHPHVPIYLTGHSLGGAIAGVIAAMQDPSTYAQGKALITSAYTFGMPRYGNKAMVTGRPTPFPILRPRDVVPWLPPVRLGFAHCPQEFDASGKPLTRGEADNVLSRMLLSNHKAEKYRMDLHANFP